MKGPNDVVKSVLSGEMSISKAYKKGKMQEKLIDRASQSLLESVNEGKVSLSKSLLISKLSREDQPAAVNKIIE